MKLLFSCFLFLAISCNQSETISPSGNPERLLPKNMTYSFDCVTQQNTKSKVTDILNQADNFLTDMATKDINITDEEQNKFGDDYIRELKKEDPSALSNGDIKEKEMLGTILKTILKKRMSPSKIKYEIFLLNAEEEVNAYTVGGKIMITKGLMNTVENEDQLYAVVGHEIGHNEKGHIKNKMKQLQISKRFFGNAGEKVYTIKAALTGSFNQKNEVEADFYGIALIYQLGYDPCTVKKFWDKMASSEHKNKIQDFFGTHPYSDVRSKCITQHIATNYKLFCN